MALIVLSFLNLWCAYHYYTVGRTLAADLGAEADQAGPMASTGSTA